MEPDEKQERTRAFQPVYTYALVLISLMATLGIQGFRYIAGLDAPRKTLLACLSGLADGRASARQQCVHPAASCYTEGEPSGIGQ